MQAKAQTASGYAAEVAGSRILGLQRRVSRHEPSAKVADELETIIRSALPGRLFPLTEISNRQSLGRPSP